MTLLLIGQPSFDREFYASSLLDGGFLTKVADSVEEAVGALADPASPSPDLVVLDLLPEPEKAWNLIAKMASSRSAISLIVFTTLIRPDGANRRRARDLGCAAFVAKPCAPTQLVDIVRRVAAGERGLETVGYDRPQ